MLLILACWGTSGIYFAGYDLYRWYQYRFGDTDRAARGGTAIVDGRREPRRGQMSVATALERGETAARMAGVASPVARGVSFRWVSRRPLYEITFDGPPHVMLLDADTGATLSPVGADLAAAIALDAFGHRVPVMHVERRRDDSFYYFRSGAYRSGAPRPGTAPYYLVWLEDPGRTLVVVSESAGQVLMMRDWWQRLYWWGYWFLHTFLFHPSGLGQLVSDLVLLAFGALALLGAITGAYLFVTYHRLRRRSRATIEKWRETTAPAR